MKQIILDSPKQFKIGLENAQGVGVKGKFSNVVICGLGGSAMPGILLCDAFGDELKLPIYIHRSYNLPRIADKKSLILCISFSGNTEETISAYQEAINKKYKVIALSTGGKLEQMAKINKTPYCLVPNDCLQPRFGTGYLFGALAQILSNCNILPKEKIQEIASLKEGLKPETFEQQGRQLAEKLIDKTPIIYASDQYKSIARIIKIKFNENSKTMAFWNYFPELNHNEMCGFANLKSQISNCKYYFIILKDEQENPQIIKRMELTAQIIKEAGSDVEIITMQGENKLEKMFNTLLLGDWASYHLAIALGLDPISVPMVENFKKRLNE
jgi:glucose/mannose-6-phosphate isomerase